MTRILGACVFAVAFSALSGCGSGSDGVPSFTPVADAASPRDAASQSPPAPDPAEPAPTPAPASDAGVSEMTDPAPGVDAGAGPASMITARCGDAPPAGARMPPPLPAYSGGACPALVSGRNVLRSGGAVREFLLVTPADLRPEETLPVVVMWHYLGGSADSMLTHGQAQESADALRFIALIPEKKGDLAIGAFGQSFDPAWPYLTTSPDARVGEEATFFDDMLACTAAQYHVDTSCISTVGVSAGALWVSQLVQLRSERLASAILLSGGVGPATSLGFIDARGWRGATHAMPVLMGWGGPGDQCGLNFQTASRNLEEGLVAGGHFLVECVHNCGHAVPPVDTVSGLRVLWQFALDHPYWLAPGESRYRTSGLPSGTPEWCGIGPGSATPRAGACPAGNVSCPVPAF